MRSPALTVLLGIALAARAPMAQSAAAGHVPGSNLSVYLMTIGQGDQVWERYGHNAIGIRDTVTGTDVVYNWGVFSFDQPGFIRRFLRGEMMYWMAGQDALATLANYQYFNRTVEVQELDLSPPQRLALLEFIQWNAREENKYYRYDYFRDNCSTRVRDALDRVLGGAIRLATDTVGTGRTYRWHSLRLMAEDPLISTGIDIGLGRPTDRPITAWEEMFIPMKLRDAIREIRLPDGRGGTVPLVRSERVLFQATREAEREAPPVRWPYFGALGLVLAGLVVRLQRRFPAGRAPVIASLVVVVGLGVVGVALSYLRLLTRHTAAWDNVNLLIYNPFWLVLVAGLRFAHSDRARRWWRGLAAALGTVAVLGLPGQVVPRLAQGSLAVMLFAAPPAAAAAWVLRERLASARAA